jgi:hypothetical protein
MRDVAASATLGVGCDLGRRMSTAKNPGIRLGATRHGRCNCELSMKSLSVALVLGLVGCGVYGDEPGPVSEPAPVAGPEKAAPRYEGTLQIPGKSPESDPPWPPSCDLAKPFGAPTKLAELGTDVGPGALTADEKTIYFSQQGALFRADRAAPWTAFGAPAAVVEFAGQSVSSVALTDDGLTMFFSDGMQPYSVVHQVERENTRDEFQSAGAKATAFQAGGTGLALVAGAIYIGAPGGAGGAAMQRCDLANDQCVWMTVPANLVNYRSPAVMRDESRIYFAKFRPQTGPSTPVFDALLERLAPNVPDQTFPSPQTVVTELDEASIPDAPLWLSTDGCRLYFRRSGSPERAGLWISAHQP